MGPLDALAVASLLTVAGTAVLAHRLWRRAVAGESQAARRLGDLGVLAEAAQAGADSNRVAIRVLAALRDRSFDEPAVLLYDEPSGHWLRRTDLGDEQGLVEPALARAADDAWEVGEPVVDRRLGGSGQRLAVCPIPMTTGERAVLLAWRAERTLEPADLRLLQASAGLLGAARATFRAYGADRVRSADLGASAAVDSLTGLMAPSAFGDSIERWDPEQGQPLTLLLISIDGLDDVASELGWRAGEEVLRIAARRLRRCLRPNDELARVDQAVFGALLADAGDPQAATAVAERALGTLRGPVAVTGGSVRVAARASVVWGGPEGAEPGKLLTEAREGLAHAHGEVAVSVRLGDDTSLERAHPR
jgi:diguanylate cyclase (GGDEF)-like protein